MTSKRNQPVEFVGDVAVYAPRNPQKSPYFRLKWTEPDGRPGDTSGGKDLDGARWKASEIAQRISQAAGPHAVTTLKSLVEMYLAEGVSPFTDEPWKESQKKQLTGTLYRSIRGHEAVRAMDVDRPRLDIMRAQGGTRNMVRSNTGALRGLLLWGYQTHATYFTGTQAELLPEGCSMPSPSIKGTAMPKRKTRARKSGDSEKFIRPEDAPDRQQVPVLGEQLDLRCPLWGYLAVEFAANSGLRWGEQFQLTVEDVHLDGCSESQMSHVHVDWQVCSGSKAGGDRRALPKGDKTRVAPVPTLSFTGFALKDALRKRVAAARVERSEGTNPQGLLYPAAKGGLMWHTTWHSKILIPAMRDAGWPLLEWEETKDVWDKNAQTYRRVVRQRTTALLTWHSLRHRFARIAIDDLHCTLEQLMGLGGWENRATVENRYYSSGKENLEAGLGKFV